MSVPSTAHETCLWRVGADRTAPRGAHKYDFIGAFVRLRTVHRMASHDNLTAARSVHGAVRVQAHLVGAVRYM